MMHPLLASTALGLVAAWPVGALGFGLGRLVERLTGDPRPRAAAWSLAYALPAGALAATVALTFSPATAPKAAPVPAAAAPRVTATIQMPDAAPAWTPPPRLADGLAWSLIGLSAAGLLTRGWRWNQGRRRLAAIRAAAQPCQDALLIEAVRQRAARLGVQPPRVRISADIAEPLLAGARRPVILLPKALADTADTARLTLVCGHELAHLRRGDNWRIPAEEALAGLFWTTLPVAALRGRMLAAREAVCDLTALDGAEPEARRDYARVLVEALRMNARPAPQLAFESAFTGRDRNLASMRLTAILQPRGAASAGRVGLVFAMGGALTFATGAGSLALADQARRLAPPALSTAEQAEARQAVAAVQAVAARDAVGVQAAVAPAMAAAPAAEAQAAVEAPEIAADAPAPLAALSPVAPVDPVDPVAPVASLDPVAPLSPLEPTPMSPRRISVPHPDPHPDPHPNPRPNPRPDPRPNPKSSAFEVVADMQETIPSRRQVVFLGDVTVKGDLDPVKVDLKVNGLPAGRWFQPGDLAKGVIKRLEVTDQRLNLKGKITVNVVMNDANP